MRYAVLLCLMIYLSSASGVRPTCRRTFRFSEMACAEFQPRIRSPLARVMYQKMMNDLGDKQDHAHWYKFSHYKLPEELAALFIEFDEDDETKAFLEQCRDKSDSLFTQLYHSLAKSILTWLMSSTSANGLLLRGSMFVFSKPQLSAFLDVNSDWQADTLLDLGAGDGMVTEKLAAHFRKVYVTETSRPMTWRLQERGYHVLGVDEWDLGERRYDLVSCLNLLDRCSRPLNLLRRIRAALTPATGRLLVAVVLPFRPYVEQGSSHRPAERLAVAGTSFSDQTASLAADVFTPAGFTVRRITKLPYLCEGDLQRAFYHLDDLLLLLTPTTT